MSSYNSQISPHKKQTASSISTATCIVDKSPVYLADNRPNSSIQKKQTEALKNYQPTKTLQKKANAIGLPDNLKSGIENLSSQSMDDVQVHYNSAQPAQLNAHAFAQGNQIHLAPGQEKHLSHEAWHVVQQKQGRVKPAMQMKGRVNVNDDKGLEKEADVMGAKAMQMKGENSFLNSQTEVSTRGNGVVQKTKRNRPSKKEFLEGAKAHKENKSISRGKAYPYTYEQYLQKFDENEKKFNEKINDKENFKPSDGDQVYHTTDVKYLSSIEANGLQPKKIEWGGPDSSKDGVLSFSRTEDGAGAMGGKSLRLKIILKAEHVSEDKEWWSQGNTELRTTQGFRREDILKFESKSKEWIPL